MAKLDTRQIKALARSIIASTPGGIRYGQLLGAIAAQSPETPRNTIQGSIWNLDQQFPKEIAKPSRGVFARVDDSEPPPPGPQLTEDDFYEPFARFLKEDLNEVTVAASLGGAGLQSKWATPDVIGVYKPLASHRIKFQPEVVSAEIKVNPKEPVVAFGQAIAYRLFSAKTYIAMPVTMTESDKVRLESLCLLFGVGLALFEPVKEAPEFQIRVRAQRFTPDMFYLNEFAEQLRRHNENMFNMLFS